MKKRESDSVILDVYTDLKQYTEARIALGRTGNSIPLKESFAFKIGHAHARDEVFSELNIDFLIEEIRKFDAGVINLKSRAADKGIYIKRPDLGRRLNDESFIKLNDLPANNFDISIQLADGLSASAINNHALPLLQILIPQFRSYGFSLAPLSIIQYGRVAISDEIGSLLNAGISIILIGERPGLSSPDSMGAYITYQPKVGLGDESRNCVSNIRSGGLSYADAAGKISFLVIEAFKRKLSGVSLKDDPSGQLSDEFSITKLTG